MYKRAVNSWWKHWDFILIDLVATQAAFVVSCFIRHGPILPYASAVYREMTIYLVLLDVIVTLCNESYKGILRRGYYREFLSTLQHVSYVAGLAGLMLYFTKSAESYSRAIFIFVWIIGIILCYSLRLLRKHQLGKTKNKPEHKVQNLFVVSEKDRLYKSIAQLRRANHEGYILCGACIIDEDNLIGTVCEEVPIVCKYSELEAYLCRNQVDQAFINVPTRPEQANEVASACMKMGIVAHIKIAKIAEYSREQQLVERVGGYTVLSRSIKVSPPRALFFKRTLDVVSGIVGIFATGLLFLFVAPAIYIKSPGPIFFSQIRVGKNGRRFKIYKFRSMYLDAEERKTDLLGHNKMSAGLMFKIDNDPRIIGGEKGKGIGNFIRNTSIDEFPQFWNILKGEMSLVGTRPPTVDEWEKYDLHHRQRLAVKPGLTGMWQVSGRSDITDFEEVVKLDTEYIVNWDVGLDLRILLKTVLVVLGRKGSV